MQSLTRATLLAVLTLSAFPVAAHAQNIASCEAADSVVGPAPRKLDLMRRYERITDTTELEVRNDVVRLISSSPDASFRLITSYEGEGAPTSVPGTVLDIVVATEKNTGMTDQQVSQSQARMSEAQTASVLIDNRTRLRLTRVNHSAEVQQGNLLRDARLLEIARFEVTPDQLRQMVTASDRVEIQAGPVRGGFGRGHVRDAKELFRVQVCAAAAAAEAAAPQAAEPST